MTQDKNFNISYLNLDRKLIEVPLEVGEVVFVLGANGTGKSALLAQLPSKIHQQTKTILAHRQLWLDSNASEVTPTQIYNIDSQIDHSNMQSDTRTKGQTHSHRLRKTIYDLINSVNMNNRYFFIF